MKNQIKITQIPHHCLQRNIQCVCLSQRIKNNFGLITRSINLVIVSYNNQQRNLMDLKKRKTLPVSQSTTELFQLTPISTHFNPYYKQVKVEFCHPLKKTKSLETPLLHRWPTFNKDGLYYTPAFVIPEDIPVLSLVSDCLKDEHLKKLIVSTEPSTKASLASFNMPHPEEQNYCGVCKMSYSDFDEHTNSDVHKEKCLNSKYTKHIYKFCNDYFPSAACVKEKNAEKTKNSLNESIRKYDCSLDWAENQNKNQFRLFFQQSSQQLSSMCIANQNILSLDVTPMVKRRRNH